jgi:hypothetical protein
VSDREEGYWYQRAPLRATSEEGFEEVEEKLNDVQKLDFKLY